MGLFGGGQATRAEVYGLFIAAVVFIGGGTAFAVTSTNSVEAPVATPTPTPTPTQASAAPVAATSASASAVAAPAPAPAPSEIAHSTDTRLFGPYIGTADSMYSEEGKKYKCGWTDTGMGNRGGGNVAEGTMECTRLYLAYIGSHCGTKDPVTNRWSGIVDQTVCTQYESRRLFGQ